jgi:hypothetical protein
VTKDMGFIGTSYKKDAVSDKVGALTTDKKRIQIILDKTTDNLTRIEIRVGTFGDESLSRLILEHIRKRLGFFSYAFSLS